MRPRVPAVIDLATGVSFFLFILPFHLVVSDYFAALVAPGGGLESMTSGRDFLV